MLKKINHGLFILLIAALGELGGASADSRLGRAIERTGVRAKRSLSAGSQGSTPRSARDVRMEAGDDCLAAPLRVPLLQAGGGTAGAADAGRRWQNRVAPLELGEPVAVGRPSFLSRCGHWFIEKIENIPTRPLEVGMAIGSGMLVGIGIMALTQPSLPHDNRMQRLNQCPDLELICRQQIIYCLTGKWPS